IRRIRESCMARASTISTSTTGRSCGWIPQRRAREAVRRTRRGADPIARDISTGCLLALTCICTPAALNGQVLTLSDAVGIAQANNREIRIAELEREKAVAEVKVAEDQRLPVFSVIALGSQPLTQLGITLERGSLGVYPADGPIPGET